MILLNDVGEVFDPHHLNWDRAAEPLQHSIDLVDAGGVGAALVDDNPIRHTVRADRSLEEPPCGGQVAALTEHEIKRLPIPIHCAVQVGPAALHLDVGLVHPPGCSGRPLPRLGPRGDLRSELHHPALQRSVVDRNPALGQDLLQVTIGDGVAQVEDNCMQEGPTSEGVYP